jgi:transcriptional regulator with XRE-family HTH domain
MPTFTWEHGMQSELAREAGVSPAYICDLLHRRKNPSASTADAIAKAAKKLGIPLTRLDLLYPSESKSPAFHA